MYGENFDWWMGFNKLLKFWLICITAEPAKSVLFI